MSEVTAKRNGHASDEDVVIRHPKFYFDNTLITIRIENTLFNVHKYQLMKSTTFSDMFAIAEESKNPDASQEGTSPDNPIVMQGVSASDFESLMTVLYARQSLVPFSHFSAHQPEPDASLIIPAFRLANMWNFAELCTYLRPLAKKSLSDVDKIAFAREFKINEWLAPTYAKLCLRESPITMQEMTRLGPEGFFYISRFREEKFGANNYYHCDPDDACAECGNITWHRGPRVTEDEAEKDAREWLSDTGDEHWLRKDVQDSAT